MDNENLLVGNPFSSKILSHRLIDRNDLVSQTATDSFLETQKPHQRPAQGATLPTHEEFRHWIVDIQDQLASTQPWNDCCQYQQVRHVMDVNHIQLFPQVQHSQCEATKGSRCEISPHVRKEISSPFGDGEPMYVHSLNK